LACLFVLFAVGLELAKPLAVTAAFSAFRSLAFIRGLALTLLAVAAVSYSLTAELSLMATTRGDSVASRQAQIESEKAAKTDRKRALVRQEDASRELAMLSGTRPAAELQAAIDGLLLTPGAEGCAAINGPVSRKVCPKVTELRKELARAERRVELEAVLATPLPPAAGNSIDGHKVKDADPGAKALATYLALLGIAVAPGILSEWLILVPVLALEIGSAFAGILVVSAGARSESPEKSKRSAPEPSPAMALVPVVHADEISAAETRLPTLERVKNGILRQLEASGGSTVQSERGLARLIGTSRPTARRALQSLAMAGVIAAEATRSGTILRLMS